MKLSAAITFFLTSWPAEGAAPATVRDYRIHLEWFRAFATERGLEHLSDLTPTLLRAGATAKMTERGEHPSNFKGGEASAAQLVAAARKLTTWLRDQGIDAPDLSMVRAPRIPERVQPRVTWDEFERMQRVVLERLVGGSKRVPRLAIARDLALLNLLAETGLRANEACSLTLRDVDFNAGLLTVRRGKGKKERVLSIAGAADDTDPQRVLRLLREWIEQRAMIRRAAEHAYLWTSIKGNPLTADQLRQVLGRICLEAGLDSNRPPHAFRRFQFSERYRAEPHAIRQLAARMGWSPKSNGMIDIYTRGVEMDFSRDRIPLLASRPRSQSPSAAPPRATDILAGLSVDERQALLKELLRGVA